MRDWHTKYAARGLIVIGVHAPEFNYEHNVENVRRAIQDLQIPYAVALDNDFKIWNAYRVWAWPSMFILDQRGAVRFTHVGEGAYAESERVIQALLNE
ncbi:Protein DipZ [Anaerolineae bacterium]|nr:Protein DipZ [Anaerolineae bacterium]